jgi:uncharacterized protein with GYD domain
MKIRHVNFSIGTTLMEDCKMPKFLITGRYTAEGLKGLQKDKATGREKAVAAACEAAGGKLDAFTTRLARP